MSKKLICGVGYNSKGKYKSTINRKQTALYGTWHRMIRRCYCPKVQARSPTYIGCEVDKDWHDYQEFADWLSNHDYYGLGYHLDKDLLVRDNKLYSSETCCLVPHQLNQLLVDSGSIRGKCPQGVYFDKNAKKYRAQVNENGKASRLGWYDDPKEAYQAYKEAKEAYVKEKALEWQDRIADDVFNALMNWSVRP